MNHLIPAFLLISFGSLLCADELPNSSRATEEFNFYKKLQEAEDFRKTNREKFAELLDEIKLSYDDLSEDNQCYFDFLKAYQKGFIGNYDSTIDTLVKLESRCKNESHQARIDQLLANLYVIRGNYEPALTHLHDAVEFTEKPDGKYLQPIIYNVAALTYRLMSQDEISLKYSQLLIDGNESNRDLCMGEFNKYRILMRQGKGEEFVDEIGAAIENCEQVQLPISALFLRFDQIRYQFSLKTTNDRMAALSAVERLKSLKLAVDDTQYKNLRVYYHALLSHVLWIANQNVEALSYAKLALNENASIGESEQLLIALNVLVEISFEEQLIEQAYDYLVQKSQVEKSIYQKKLASQVAYYRVKHANLAQELEIEQLNQSNKVLLLEKKLSEQEAKKQQLLIMLVISLFMALAVWAFRIKRKHDYFKQVADIDHLTQVFTRKAFEERMKELLTDCSEQNLPLNLAIMDLDHFKKVNDLYGHLVGDWVLRNVILVCEEVADQDILIARLGGEEFSIVCPGISQDTMMKLMERMRVAIEIMDCRESGADFNITASFGVSSTVLSGYRISSLLTHADLALFEAKNKGRNKVYSFAMMDQNINSAD